MIVLPHFCCLLLPDNTVPTRRDVLRTADDGIIIAIFMRFPVELFSNSYSFFVVRYSIYLAVLVCTSTIMYDLVYYKLPRI